MFCVALTRCKVILILSSFSRMPRKEAYQMGMEGVLMPESGEDSGVIASLFLSQLGSTASRAISGELFLRNLGVI